MMRSFTHRSCFCLRARQNFARQEWNGRHLRVTEQRLLNLSLRFALKLTPLTKLETNRAGTEIVHRTLRCFSLVVLLFLTFEHSNHYSLKQASSPNDTLQARDKRGTSRIHNFHRRRHRCHRPPFLEQFALQHLRALLPY